MGPDYKSPDLPFSTPDSYQHVSTKTVKPEIEDRWWYVFDDQELNRLVEETLRNNLDIKRAAAIILEMQSKFIMTRADRFPSLSLGANANRQRQPKTASMPGFSVKRETERYNLSFPASFEVDLWGRLARAQEADWADILQAEESRRTICQAVVAETISLYFQMESLERQIQVAVRSIENYQQSLGLVESRYRRGLTSILDLRQARRILAQAETFLPSLRQELGATQQKLAVLLGRYPRTLLPRFQPEDYFKHLASVPARLPSQLLLRRPDIKAAEAKLKSLNARVGAARAGRFPRITLTGSFGYSSEELDRLVRPESELWNLVLGIVQPLFDAGRLKAGEKAAQARYTRGVAEYAKTVLTAFSEVENALLTRKEQLKRRERELVFLFEARATQEVAESRYRRGLVDYLTVLEAQQTRIKAEQGIILVDLAILSNRVSLHRSLGGGWDELTGQLRDKESKLETR